MKGVWLRLLTFYPLSPLPWCDVIDFSEGGDVVALVGKIQHGCDMDDGDICILQKGKGVYTLHLADIFC